MTANLLNIALWIVIAVGIVAFIIALIRGGGIFRIIGTFVTSFFSFIKMICTIVVFSAIAYALYYLHSGSEKAASFFPEFMKVF